jgi:hypothetical protein
VEKMAILKSKSMLASTGATEIYPLGLCSKKQAWPKGTLWLQSDFQTSQTSLWDAPEAKGSWGACSETLALCHAYQALCLNPSPTTVIHRGPQHDTLIHLNGQAIENVTILPTLDHQNIESELKAFHLWQPPENLDVIWSPKNEQDVPPRTCLNANIQESSSILTQQFDHKRLVLFGAAHAALKTGQLPLPLEKKQHNHPGEQPLIIAGCGILFLLGCWWISNMIQLSNHKSEANSYLSALKSAHQTSLEPGQRRTFSEMSFIKRLERDAEKSSSQHQGHPSLHQALLAFQTCLEHGPDFECLSIDAQPGQGKLNIKGKVLSVQDYERLIDNLEQKVLWSITSNANRIGKSGSGLMVYLRLERKP